MSAKTPSVPASTSSSTRSATTPASARPLPPEDAPDARPFSPVSRPHRNNCRCLYCVDPDEERDREHDLAADEGRTWFGGRWI